MRKVCLIVMFLASVAMADYRPDRDCALTTVALKVVDEHGNPLEGAKVLFRVFTTFDKCYRLMRDTDANGDCEISGKTRGEITVVVDKDGYYTSYGNLRYRDLPWDDAVAERRWTRGVVSNTVVMKKVGNPERHQYGVMRAKKPPKVNEALAFDAAKCDWCAPYGAGTVDDFYITCCVSTNTANREVYSLVLEARKCVDGFVQRETDEWSCFRYDQAADPSAEYAKTIRSGCLMDDDGAVSLIPESASKRYTIFRTRTETNETGRIVSSHYGVILEGLKFDGELTLGVQLNPRNNDTSLEDNWAFKHMKKGR